MSEKKYTIVVDFDGVINSHTTPYDPETYSPYHIPDEPVPGAFEWLQRMQKRFRVILFTARLCGESWPPRVQFKIQRELHSWFNRHGYPEELVDELDFWNYQGKPPALVYIDDRGYRFTGDNFPTAHEIREMIPWNKKTPWSD